MVDVLKIAVLMCVSRRNKVLKNVVYINPHLHVRFKGFLLLNCELFASLKKRRIPRRSLQIGVHRRALPSKMKQQARLYHNICLSYPVIFGLSENREKLSRMKIILHWHTFIFSFRTFITNEHILNV